MMRKSKTEKQVRRTYTPPPPPIYGRFSLPKISPLFAPLFKFHPPQQSRTSGRPILSILALTAILCLTHCSSDDNGGVGGTPDDGPNTPIAQSISIGSSGAHACAVVDKGVQCWGFGYNGRLGNGSNDDQSIPVDVVSADGSTDPLSGVTADSAGNEHTCADGQWGREVLGRGRLWPVGGRRLRRPQLSSGCK